MKDVEQNPFIFFKDKKTNEIKSLLDWGNNFNLGLTHVTKVKSVVTDDFEENWKNVLGSVSYNISKIKEKPIFLILEMLSISDDENEEEIEFVNTNFLVKVSLTGHKKTTEFFTNFFWQETYEIYDIDQKLLIQSGFREDIKNKNFIELNKFLVNSMNTFFKEIAYSSNLFEKEVKPKVMAFLNKNLGEYLLLKKSQIGTFKIN